VIYSVVSKKLFGKYEQLTIAFYQFFIGAACFFPFIFLEEVIWSDVDTEIIIHVLILGVFASAIGFFLYLVGLEKLGMGESSLYINLIPLVTVILSIFYLGESVNINQILGGALVMLSVYGINKDSKKEILEIKEFV
ncbi:MAG: DMT family transporter, partial [Acidaminobacteraceae bacterium]